MARGDHAEKSASPRDKTAREAGRVTSRRTPVHPATPPQRRTIVLAHGEVPYTLKTSTRARRLRLTVRPGGELIVTTPPGVRLPFIENVLREKAVWIESTLKTMSERKPVSGLSLHDGASLPFNGVPVRLTLHHVPTSSRSRVSLRGEQLELTTSDPGVEATRQTLEAWYRRQAHAIFTERAKHWNAQFDFTYGRIAIKDQKSRWGSCSRTGNLNFNWRLLLAPAEILDYIVIHELAHLKEPNHSPRFWALVATLCPDYKQKRAWLRTHGEGLRF